jgi:hypothetical protein
MSRDRHTMSLSRATMYDPSFLTTGDRDRVYRTLQKLSAHDISEWALTGGLAVEMHVQNGGGTRSTRTLNDLDFITDGFAGIPTSLAGKFLFRHIQPLDPPGKIILQLIDGDSSLRVDVFRAYGTTMSRTTTAQLGPTPLRLISREDLTARAARLVLDLAAGKQVEQKHASDYLRMATLVNASQVEVAWRDQRKPTDPITFREANVLLRELIPARSSLVTTVDYSQDLSLTCPRCLPSPPFELADRDLVHSLLGIW